MEVARGERLPGVCRVLGPIPSTTEVLGIMVRTCSPSIWEVEQGNHKFKVGLSYTGSCRLAWDTWDTVLSTTNLKL